jgi:hypothetical protein
MTPRAQSIAFQIWRYCEPLGWNVTLQELADETNTTKARIGRILKAKKWHTRIRANKCDYHLEIAGANYIHADHSTVASEFDDVMG